MAGQSTPPAYAAAPARIFTRIAADEMIAKRPVPRMRPSPVLFARAEKRAAIRGMRAGSKRR
jgi:hypothetical protein